MRIAIGFQGDKVAPSFGQCVDFRIIDIEHGHVVRMEDIHDTEHLRFKRPQFLKNLRVELLIINDIGTPGFKLMEQFDIALVHGEYKTVDEALNLYLKGELNQEIIPHEPHRQQH